ncbi:MAG: CRISPR-associated endoribonuclease Cas6 [Candidatus Bathyarchaeia archaeon]
MVECFMTQIVVRFSINFTSLSNIIIPPFSSKVSRTLFIRMFNRGVEKPVEYFSSEKFVFKPLILTPVYWMDGKRYLFKVDDSEGLSKPLILRENTKYCFYAVLISRGGGELSSLIQGLAPSLKLELFNGEVLVENIGVEVKSFEGFGFKDSDGLIRVEFKTPVLISFPKSWVKLERKTPARHSLFPIPSFMIHGLAEHWNSYAPEELKIPNVAKLRIYSNYSLVEQDYSVKPVTAVYDEKRRPRGFIGWTLYKHRRLNRSLDESLLKLLDYANYVGVGRSRSIGFGVVEVKPYNLKTSQPVKRP